MLCSKPTATNALTAGTMATTLSVTERAENDSYTARQTSMFANTPDSSRRDRTIGCARRFRMIHGRHCGAGDGAGIGASVTNIACGFLPVRIATATTRAAA